MRHFLLGIALIGSCFLAQPLSAQTSEPEPVLAEGPGREVAEWMCGQCHPAADRISKERKTAEEWAEVIADMQGRGLEAEEKDIQVVLAYLAKHYGPAAQQDSRTSARITPLVPSHRRSR